jgi:hypothetical protein
MPFDVRASVASCRAPNAERRTPNAERVEDAVPDIMLDLGRLRATGEGLRASIREFENATNTADGLEQAVGRPDDRTRLRDRAHAFEGDWNDRRAILIENLAKVQEQLEAIVDGWTDWDVDTASELTCGPAAGPQPEPVLR